MTRIVRFSITTLAAMLATSHVRAQQPLSLGAAQAEARQHAPEPPVLDAHMQGAEAIAQQAARAQRIDPELSAGVFPGPLTGRPDESGWTLGARWTVDVSKSWVPRGQSAAADVDRSRFEREDGLRVLDERVAIAVADVALGQRLVARAERLRDLQAIVADAEHRRLDAGDGTQVEADAADLDLAGARATVEQAGGDLSMTRARLARVLGRSDATNLVVEDPPESDETAVLVDLSALIDRDPRVRAAQAELSAAQFERQVAERLMTPMPTFGLDAGNQRRDIPAGSFQGVPLFPSVSATWTDPEVSFNIAVPIPLFDRQREPRARATARILAAQAQVAVARADVRSELGSAWEALQAARRALQAVAVIPALVDRDITFVDQAVRAGAFDALTRTQALRRLDESGRRADAAVRDLRTARAAWSRRTASLVAVP